MVAKTYDQERDFDLAREYDRLVDSSDNGKDLEDAGCGTIPSSAVLQGVAVHLTKQVRRLLAGGVRRLDPSAVNFDQLAAELNEPPVSDGRSTSQQSSFW